MKKLLCIVLVSLTASVTFAQTPSPTTERSIYTAKFIMPNLSVQNIFILANPDGKKQFLRVVTENVFNITPITLKQKSIEAGYLIHSSQQPFVTESQAYRFLANQLDEKSKVEKILDKNTHSVLFTKSKDGIKTILDVYWLEPYQRWCITITQLSNEDYAFNANKDCTIMHL